MPEAKVAIITGASGSLAPAVIAALSREYRLVLTSRRPPAILPVGARFVPRDLSQPGASESLVASALATEGRVDALVNLVGGYVSGSVAETDDEAFSRVLDLNLRSAFSLSRAVIPALVAKGRGRIVHISSQGVLAPYAGAAAYLIAKAGVATLVRCLAAELKGTGVTANALLPTIVDTPQNRASMPEADPAAWVPLDNLGDTVAFLLSDGAASISGALLPLGLE